MIASNVAARSSARADGRTSGTNRMKANPAASSTSASIQAAPAGRRR
jgi:hypothetical protein